MNVHPSAPVAAQPLMSERKVALIGALIVLLGPLSMVLFTPAMPELVRVFGTTEAVVKMTLLLYFVGFALAQLVCGPISDGVGRKPVTMVFLTIYLVASVLALFAPTIEALIAARFLQGIGAAVGVAISRAIVRDLFTGESSARIMNMIGMIMGIGPALAPTLGGVTLELFGWQAIFALMLVLGLVIAAIVNISMVETVPRDLSRIRPRALIRSYGTLLSSGYFIASSMVMAGALGAFFTLATILPFVLMDRVGLTPTQFGLGMLMHSLSFFLGTLVVRRLLGPYGAFRIVPAGFVFIAAGGVLLAVLLRVMEPGFLVVMGPMALYVFGAAFVMPAMSTASVAPFPHIAGAAGALAGFMQMGGGLLGGVLAAVMGDPVAALATVIPGMGLTAIVSWLVWRSLPEPPLAKVTLADTPTPPPAE